MTFTDRLEAHERTGIDDITDRFAEGFAKPFAALEGRVLEGEDTPDPLDYPDDDAGRRAYLVDCWEHAVGDLAATIVDEPDQPLELSQDVEPGDFDGWTRERTEAFDAAILAHLEHIRKVIEARKRVEQVEEAIRDA